VVLFGSDYTINDPAGVIVRAQKAGLGERAKEVILGGNVARMSAERGVNL
jgi:predicted TIM-barrel fold metal-dependent hydrolase